MMLRVSGTALEYRFGETDPPPLEPEPCGADVDTMIDPVVLCCIAFWAMTLLLRSSHFEMES